MSSLKNKLNNYEVTPPAAAWDKIAAALDESEIGAAFPSRLYDMELSPPLAAWDNIHSSLSPAEAPVVPMKKKAPFFIRYAAAAAIIAIAAFVIIKWTGNTSGTEQVAETQHTDIKDTGISSQSNRPAADQVSPSIPEQVPAIAIPEKNESLIAFNKQPAKINNTQGSRRAIAEANYDYVETYADQYTNPIYAYQDHVPSLADRYIMLMTPEGNLIRMSKKWENLVCCVSGEEQDADCKSKLKQWQEKMAASPAATSPGNFLDILSLIGSLDEVSNEL
jgi:hypothetical protein